jgi:hypothetical protein
MAEEGRRLVQNKQNVQRWRYRSGYTYLPSLSGQLRSFVGPFKAVNRDKSKPSGKTHKLPKMSQLRNAGDFQFQLIDKSFHQTDEQTNETKMQMNLRKQIKTQRM